MYLFIFQSIGTQELILIGIFALIFLGPRKLPEYARKIGKMMAEFRGTADEFRSTWEKEIDFEEESKALTLGSIEDEIEKPVSRETGIDENAAMETPAILPVDDERLEELRAEADRQETANREDDAVEEASDKRNWL
ncbi:MAG: twin-arginine translocase TatA/TatE family subunit [Acidobacteria bacterium]|nr:twin-arginine translocase TatA/TatE family subunit [Acidobacteriota bacterium]